MKNITTAINYQLRRLWARIPFGQARFCCLCQSRVGRFLPYKGGVAAAPALTRALEVIGSDLDHHECPVCGCHDRERHLLLYCQATDLLSFFTGKRLLHLAPEPNLTPIILRSNPAVYIRGDLFPTQSDVSRIDVERLPFAEQSFDVVIANHLLEHVENLDAALSEIARVLAPQGYAILQTPFSRVLMNKFEDKGVDTPEGRLQAFGQEDHLRLFGRDIHTLIERFGFLPQMLTHSELLPKANADRYGVNSKEPFMLFRRASEHGNR